MIDLHMHTTYSDGTEVDINLSFIKDTQGYIEFDE